MDPIPSQDRGVSKTPEAGGLARVDFLLERPTGRFFVNEVNTIPGFTPISMYPKLWAASGLSPEDLLEELLRHALRRFRGAQARLRAGAKPH